MKYLLLLTLLMPPVPDAKPSPEIAEGDHVRILVDTAHPENVGKIGVVTDIINVPAVGPPVLVTYLIDVLPLDGGCDAVVNEAHVEKVGMPTKAKGET